MEAVAEPILARDGDVEESGTEVDEWDVEAATVEGEAQDAEETSEGRHNDANVAVEEHDAGGPCSVGGCNGLAGPELSTTDFGWQSGSGGGCVGADDDFRIEHGYEGLEIASAQSGKELIDDSSLF